ncbi:MAG: glycosyltransferase [Candidatus Kapabacteria bacterium]|jgi:GT2 family glycosyltransferase|nr:glycosyltransferase [Candidatus Kapabacteria bacterium]
MIVIIPTCNRPELIKRTLDSLSEVIKPDCYSGTIVIENGSKNGVEELVKSYNEKLNFSYMFTEQANKSHAMNVVLKEITDTAIFFSDDDVIYDKNLLTEYAEAVKDIDSGVFCGGPVEADYELEPSDFLKKYLPMSATGTNWPDDMSEVDKPIFLGSNWLAFANDLKVAGGFDSDLGPGTTSNSTGDETDMQRRLMRNVIKGRYVPGAIVKHFVPEERCSPEWAVDRRSRVGAAYALINKSSKYELFMMRIKTVLFMIFRKFPFISYETKFKLDCSISYLKGRLNVKRSKKEK